MSDEEAERMNAERARLYAAFPGLAVLEDAQRERGVLDALTSDERGVLFELQRLRERLRETEVDLEIARRRDGHYVPVDEVQRLVSMGVLANMAHVAATPDASRLLYEFHRRLEAIVRQTSSSRVGWADEPDPRDRLRQAQAMEDAGLISPEQAARIFGLREDD